MEFGAWLLLILVIIISCMLLINRKWQEENSRFPPGPIHLPVIGNLLQIRLNDMANSLMKLHKKYGSMYTVYLGSQRYIVLCGYQTVKEALVDNAEAFSGRGPYPLFANFTKGNDIAFSSGEKWKQLRRFSLAVLGHFGMGKRSMEERIQEEVGYLIKYFSDTKACAFDPQLCMSRSFANIISSTVFGDRYDYDDKEFEELIHCIQNSFQAMSSTWGTLYHIYSDTLDYLPGPHKKLFKDLQKVGSFILRKAKKNQETLDLSCSRDYIDSFLIKMEQEKNNPSSFFNWDTLVMCTFILFFGGTESGSTTIRFGFIQLMKNPEVQEKVQEEIDSVIGRHRTPAYEHRSQMPYTMAVIHEIQRIADVIPLALTHSLTENIQFKGYKFQKGTVFIPMLTSVHFDPLYYKEPEKFDPRNFLDETGCFLPNPAFMPLLAGKRLCVGANLANMELFIYITTILQNFTLKPEGSPEEVDARPIGIFLANIPRPFKLSFIPR